MGLVGSNRASVPCWHPPPPARGTAPQAGPPGRSAAGGTWRPGPQARSPEGAQEPGVVSALPPWDWDGECRAAGTPSRSATGLRHRLSVRRVGPALLPAVESWHNHLHTTFKARGRSPRGSSPQSRSALGNVTKPSHPGGAPPTGPVPVSLGCESPAPWAKFATHIPSTHPTSTPGHWLALPQPKRRSTRVWPHCGQGHLHCPAAAKAAAWTAPTARKLQPEPGDLALPSPQGCQPNLPCHVPRCSHGLPTDTPHIRASPRVSRWAGRRYVDPRPNPGPPRAGSRHCAVCHSSEGKTDPSWPRPLVQRVLDPRAGWGVSCTPHPLGSPPPQLLSATYLPCQRTV